MAQAQSNLLLAANCNGGCGTTTDLGNTSCGHMTLCIQCAKVLAHIAAPCAQCGVCVTKLIKEYEVRAYKLEGGEEATRYTMSMQGVEFRASPATDWFPFRIVVHGLKKPLTFQEAEEHMSRGRKLPVDGPKTPTIADRAKTPQSITTPSVAVKRKAHIDASQDVTDPSSIKKSRPQATVEKCENAASKGRPSRKVVKPLTIQEGAEHLKPAVGRKPAVDGPKTPMTAYALKTLRSVSTPSAGGKRKVEADASKDETELISNKVSNPQATPRSATIPSAGVKRKTQADASEHVADSSSIKKSKPQAPVENLGEKAAPKKGVVRRHVPVADSKPRTLLWDCGLIRSL